MNPTGNDQNGHGKSRLDRLEGLMELLVNDHLKFSDEHNKLLTAQVLLTDAQTRTEKTVKELAEGVKELRERINDLTERMNDLTERMNDLTERMNALINVVDGIIRKPPAGPSV